MPQKQVKIAVAAHDNTLSKTINNNIDFSIIVPIYNCGRYLEKCILSILEQTYSSFELFLLNDGSTDTSLKICEKYAKKDKRITVIDKKNSGVSDTRNLGIKKAKGKYICFVDSDDYIEPNYLETARYLFSKYPKTQLLNFGFFSDVCSKTNKTASSDVINTSFHYFYNKKEIHDSLIRLWDEHMLYNIWNKVFLKDVILKNNLSFSSKYFGEDMEFNQKYLTCIDTFLNSDQCFYHYVREREGSVTKQYKKDIFRIRRKEFHMFNAYFQKEGFLKKEYYEFTCRRFIERVLGCIENEYCASSTAASKYAIIKQIIHNEDTVEAVKFAKPKTRKMKIALFPIKYRLTIITMFYGKMFNIIKRNFPSTFNKLKNRR